MTEQTATSYNRKVASKVFFGVFLLLLATAPAISWWGDALEACQGALSLIQSNMPFAKAPTGEEIVSVRPLLHILSCAPSAFFLSPQSIQDGAIIRLLRAIIPIFFGAASASLFYLILRQLRLSIQNSVILAVGLVFSTPLWVYSRIHYSEGLQTFLLLALFYILLVPDFGKRNQCLLAGCLAGMLINAKTTYFSVVPFIFLFQRIHGQNLRSRIIAYAHILLGLTPWIGAWLAFNYLRFDEPFTTGYSKFAIWRHPMTGFFGQLLSPGKSIFLYAPLTLLGFICFFAKLFRSNPTAKPSLEEMLLLCFFMFNLLIFSSWYSWSGDWSWGPRHLIPFIPLLILPLAQKIAHNRQTGKTARIPILIIVAGFLIQVPVVILGVHNLSQFLVFLDRAAFNTTRTAISFSDDMIFGHFVPDFSPIVLQFRLLGKMLSTDGSFNFDFSQWSGETGPYRVPGFAGRTIELTMQPDLWLRATDNSKDFYIYMTITIAVIIAGTKFLQSALKDNAEKRVRM